MTIDLTTLYGSLTLESPVIIGACPMSAHELTRIALVSSGAGAVILPSIFEEQVLFWNKQNGIGALSDEHGHDQSCNLHEQMATEVVTDAAAYLELVKRACSPSSIPVIASMNGFCRGNWMEFAKQLELAGANAIEFNVRSPMPDEYADSKKVEDAIVATAEKINAAISIPLFLKLGRQYTCLSHLARRLVGKAQGLVLFGHAPEVDICMDSLKLMTKWGLTEPGSIARSINSIMQVHSFCPEMSLAANGGIGSATDLAKVLMAGADVGMIASAVYRDGPDVVGSWLDGLRKFMERHDMSSLQDLKDQRPKCFGANEDRLSYINALSTQPDPSQLRSADRTLECDRWGHIK